MHTRNFIVVLFVELFALTSALDSRCRGEAKYEIVFENHLTPENFGDLIPSTGLNYSSLVGVSHSNRQSLFTVRGFASRGVQQLAEQGINTRFFLQAKLLRDQGQGVLSVIDVFRTTLPGLTTAVTLTVNCEHPFVTVIGAILRSPDWFVQISNMNLYDFERKRFVKRMSGDLIAYDAGVDDGRDFSPPQISKYVVDLTPDLPSSPKKNIAPLVEDATDRFEGREVGLYTIKRIR